jgi:hypothetical protein
MQNVADDMLAETLDQMGLYTTLCVLISRCFYTAWLSQKVCVLDFVRSLLSMKD